MNMCEYSNDLAKMVYKSFCFMSHMLLLSRLSRQDLRVNSLKTTYKTVHADQKLIFGLTVIVVSRSVRALVLLYATGDTFDDKSAHSCTELVHREICSE